VTFEEDQEVLVRFPLTIAQEDGDRADWPWVAGRIARECGDNEWEVVVTDERMSWEEGGQRWYPTCYRDSSEIRPA
jgi:hypothetical protein